MTRARWAVALLAVGLLAPAGCSDDGPAEGEARLEVQGEAIVDRAGGDRDVVTDRTDVGPGDRIELTDGTATMALRGGTRFELRAADGKDDAASVVRMARVPELEGGDLLVTTPGRTSVSAAGTSVEVARGAAKLTRALGMGVEVYDAAVAVDSAGQERKVPALRSLLVPALGRPQPLRPVTYDAADAWDRRYLGDAIELGQRLEDIASSYTSTLRPGEGRTPGFFRLVLPGLDEEPSFSAELLDAARPPGETLIGAAIADLGHRGDFTARWTSVFSFRDDGAEWGIVALDQAVSRTPLLGSITEAINASPLAFAPVAGTPVGTTGSGVEEPAGSTTATTAPSGSSTTTSPPPPTTLPPTTVPPPTVPPPPDTPLTPVLEPVVEPVTDLVGGLIDGLVGGLFP
jgi:hypothetical protein